MNREFGRKNSRRILGGKAGLPKIYVGRWGGVPALISLLKIGGRKIARWASPDLGPKKISDHTTCLGTRPASIQQLDAGVAETRYQAYCTHAPKRLTRQVV